LHIASLRVQRSEIIAFVYVLCFFYKDAGRPASLAACYSYRQAASALLVPCYFYGHADLHHRPHFILMDRLCVHYWSQVTFMEGLACITGSVLNLVRDYVCTKRPILFLKRNRAALLALCYSCGHAVSALLVPWYFLGNTGLTLLVPCNF